MPSLLGLLRLFNLPFISLTTSAPDAFENKTILLTCGASGIGLAAAQHFAQLGTSRIILGVRSIEKGNTIAHSLSSISSNADLQIDVWELDMMSFESVVKFSKRCGREVRGIDVAVMNAGKAVSKFELSSDGWESELQVNVLSTALLSCLLLSQLVETAKTQTQEINNGLGGIGTPHLVIVGSDAHYQAEFPERNENNILESLNIERSFNGHEFDRYCVSKLFDLYIAIELAARVPRVKGSPMVVVNCVTPGFCATPSIHPSEIHQIQIMLSTLVLGLLAIIIFIIITMTEIREMARVTLFGSHNSIKGAAFEPKRDIPSLAGKVVLITGAAGDLGRNTAIQLARYSYGRPARLYIADLPHDDKTALANHPRGLLRRARGPGPGHQSRRVAYEY